MVSPIATDKCLTRNKYHVVDHDPGGTGAVLASPDGGTTPDFLDMRDYVDFVAIASPSVVGGNGITKMEIVAATDTAFTTPVVIKDSGAIQADALGDYVILECDEQDLIASGTSLRYVAARLTMATGTDEAKVIYVATAKRPHDGLSATTIA